MPQCGLAPGFIGIVGNALARRFDTLLDLRLRDRRGLLEEGSYPICVVRHGCRRPPAQRPIQLSTAASICAALDPVAQEVLPQRGFVSQEQISLEALLGNRFGRVYVGKPLALANAMIEDR